MEPARGRPGARVTSALAREASSHTTDYREGVQRRVAGSRNFDSCTLATLDDSRDPATCVVTAILIPADSWRTVFDKVKAYRRHLKRTDGMFTRKEWHATDFVAGRGRIADQTITKGRRAQIFGELLRSLEVRYLSDNVDVRYMVDDVDSAANFCTKYFGFTLDINASPAFADVVGVSCVCF